MTIYSLHPNRGKVQVLATHYSPAGLAATTVTSVTDTTTAVPIVDALNRISAYVTIPQHTEDERDDQFRRYPHHHLDALISPDARPSLLTGAHGLWYEYVKVLLHQALEDLDDALADAPAPVRTAISAELHTEGTYLRDKPSELDDIGATDPLLYRVWDYSHPAVLADGGMHNLTDNFREQLDDIEKRLTPAQLRASIDDLRLLAAAHRRLLPSPTCRLEAEYLSITEDPENTDRYFLELSAPHPDKKHSHLWTLELQLWIPDDDDIDDFDDSSGTATSENVLDCQLPTPPTADEIVALFTLCAKQPDLLTTWAETPVGEPLAHTSYIVAARHDS